MRSLHIYFEKHSLTFIATSHSSSIEGQTHCLIVDPIYNCYWERSDFGLVIESFNIERERI